MQSLSKTFVFFFAEPFYSCCAEQNDSSYHRLSMSAHTLYATNSLKKWIENSTDLSCFFPSLSTTFFGD